MLNWRHSPKHNKKRKSHASLSERGLTGRLERIPTVPLSKSESDNKIVELNDLQNIEDRNNIQKDVLNNHWLYSSVGR